MTGRAFKRRGDYRPRKNYKPMDVNIQSRQSVRERVARFMLLHPEDGKAGAIKRCADALYCTEQTVRDILEFDEEAVS